MMNAQQLIQKLERIVAEYGPATLVEARNPAGDFDYVEHVGLRLGVDGVSVISIETWHEQTQDYDRGDGVFIEAKFPQQGNNQ